jgi:hypothetical protein
VLAIRRAGADLVLTYWATELAGWLTPTAASAAGPVAVVDSELASAPLAVPSGTTTPGSPA